MVEPEFNNPLLHPMFERAMLAKGLNQSDIRMVRDVAQHASTEALKRMMAVCETVPAHIMPSTLLAAVALLQSECGAQISALLAELTGMLKAKGIDVEI